MICGRNFRFKIDSAASVKSSKVSNAKKSPQKRLNLRVQIETNMMIIRFKTPYHYSIRLVFFQTSRPLCAIDQSPAVSLK